MSCATADRQTVTISMASNAGTKATDDDSWRAGRWLERVVELSRYAAGFAGRLGWVGFDGRFFAVGLQRSARMKSAPLSTTQPQLSTGTQPPHFRTTARDFVNPVDYQHPHPSMAQFADWKPKTLRQTVAATRLFFTDLLHHRD